MKALLLMSCLLALGACRGDTPASVFDGSDQVWSLKTLNGQVFLATATLTIPKAGEINGRAPCNRYFGGLAGTYPAFNAGPIGSTKMACPDLRAESAYLAALESATTATVANNTLTLTNGDGLEMVFTNDG